MDQFAGHDRPTRVGFIGLGAMGSPMARRICDAGFDLIVFDAIADLAAQFSNVANCKSAMSAAAVAPSVDVLITMLPTSRHVREVLFDEGVAAALPSNAIVIDMSTGDPEDTLRMAGDLERLGLRFIDAPVCRGRQEAESGRLLVLAGGDVKDIEHVRPVLSAMSESIDHVGPIGAGIRLKLVNNYLSMVHMVLAAEGLVFATKLGIDRQAALELFSKTPAGRGQMLTNFPRKVLAGDVTADFPMSMGLKDLSLALKLGADIGSPLMLGAAARELFGLAKPWGRAHEDCTAMLLLIEDLARVRDHSSAPAGMASALV